MKKRVPVLVILVLCAAAAFAGCTGPAGTPAQPAAAGAPAATQAAAASSVNNLVTSPTDVIPDNNYVSVIVQEKDYNAKIPVVFDGGKGQYLVKSASVTIYRSDGQVMTANLGIKKGDLVEMEGTKQTDRVVAYVTEVNGQTYKVADALSPYRTR
jgi:hypothetical protein